MKKFIFLLILLITINEFNLYSENSVLIEGSVRDKTSDKVIPGASIRVLGSNKGTYTSSKGVFRLSVELKDTLLIKSIGYEPFKYVVVASKDKVEFKLNPKPVRKENVDVTASITAEQIIERAVKKRDENLKLLKTFSGDLYSKLVLELGGTVVNATSDDNSFSLSAAITGSESEASDSRRFIIMETYSNVQRDFEKKINQTQIIKRRQTANIPSEQNLMAITEFISFYDDEVNLINTKIPSPIGNEALSSYNFTLKDRILLEDRYIYVIGVEPNSKIYPRFEGELKIVENTYNVIDIDLRPSENTFIPFFKDLSVKQKYTESLEKVWYSSFLEIGAKVKVEVIKGLIDFDADIKVTSIFSDAEINKPLPDSLYNNHQNAIAAGNLRRIQISPMADKQDSTFWQKNSLSELSPREVEIYSRVDSAVKVDSIKKENSEAAKGKNVGFSIMPYLDFNRVTSVSLGLSPELGFYGFDLYGTGYFSFGLQDYFGNVGLRLPEFRILGNRININTNIYSNQNVFGTSPGAYSRLYNTIAAALVHEDYYDYFANEGFESRILISNKYFDIGLTGIFERQGALNNTTNNSLFESYQWRYNILSDEGDYRILKAELKIGDLPAISTGGSFDYEANINIFSGMENISDISFNGFSGRILINIPTFATGYNPMNLNIILSGGLTSDQTPVQYQHRLQSRLFIFNNPGNFYSAPIGHYGGNKYYSAQVNYNLTDIWWRWLGLPTYEGRGIDLLLGGTWGVFENSTNSAYRSTGDDGYAEVGFGFSRIPTFVSNVVYWSFDWRFGIGKNADGRSGGALMISLPF